MALYSLSGGTGKTRAMRDGSFRTPRSWRISILSSGELPVGGKLMEEKGRKPRAGQLVRLLDIHAARTFGVFDNVGPDGAACFAEACALAATKAYGTAGPWFVRRLIAEHVNVDDVRSMIDEFVAGQVPFGADGQVVRAAHRFGIVAAAGELAARFEIAPWRVGEARSAAAWALAEWIEGRSGTESAEVRQAIEQVRLFIEQPATLVLTALTTGTRGRFSIELAGGRTLATTAVG
jgi:putative DNA primase/helicase